MKRVLKNSQRQIAKRGILKAGTSLPNKPSLIHQHPSSHRHRLAATPQHGPTTPFFFSFVSVVDVDW